MTFYSLPNDRVSHRLETSVRHSDGISAAAVEDHLACDWFAEAHAASVQDAAEIAASRRALRQRHRFDASAFNGLGPSGHDSRPAN